MRKPNVSLRENSELFRKKECFVIYSTGTNVKTVLFNIYSALINLSLTEQQPCRYYQISMPKLLTFKFTPFHSSLGTSRVVRISRGSRVQKYGRPFICSACRFVLVMFIVNAKPLSHLPYVRRQINFVSTPHFLQAGPVKASFSFCERH